MGMNPIESSGEGCARARTRGLEICIAAAVAAAAAEGHCITMCAKWLIPPPPHSRTDLLFLGCFERRFVHLSYSGYLLKKSIYLEFGLNLTTAESRPDFGYLYFFNQ